MKIDKRPYLQETMCDTHKCLQETTLYQIEYARLTKKSSQ